MITAKHFRKKMSDQKQQQQARSPDLQMQQQHQMIVASTFANLELSSVKKTLAQYTSMYEAARSENAKLVEEMKQRDSDAMQVVEFLHKELEQKNALIVSLQSQVSNGQRDFDAKQAQTEQSAKAQIADREETIEMCRQEIARLESDLESLAAFKRERQEVLLEIARAKERHGDMVNKYERELTKIRFQALEEKVKLRSVEEEMTEKFNKEVDLRAMVLVDVKAKGVYEENAKLAEAKDSLAREVDDLVLTATMAQSDLQRAKREVELGVQSQQIYAKRGAQLARVAKESTSKVRTLEDRVEAVTAEWEGRLARQEEEHRAELAAARREAESAKMGYKQARQELAHMRKLARHVLGQRSDLEHFFHEALAQVRREVEKEEREEAASAAAAASARVPSFLSPRGTVFSGSQTGSTRTPRGDTKGRLIGVLSSGTRLYTTPPQTARTTLMPIATGERKPEPKRFDGSTDAKSQKILESASGCQHSTHRIFKKNSQEQQVPARPHEGQEPPLAIADTPPAQGEDGPDFAPPPSSRGVPPLELNVGRDFSGLSWRDKERVIKALLFHINKNFYRTKKRDSNAHHHDRADHVFLTQQMANDGGDDGNYDHEFFYRGEGDFDPVVEAVGDELVSSGLFPQRGGRGAGNNSAGSRPPTQGAAIASASAVDLLAKKPGSGFRPPMVPRPPPAKDPSVE